ncbi:serine/threonine protein kinase [Cytobacillus gottheilii]|uniref:serine/threonine protein kinase n=1 Tax=Cytobacillus gottheilii TaxID=859144 RepID=UPI002148E776|nr:protein kinase [Cytobacillus gottheilii]
MRKMYQFFLDKPIKKGTILNDAYEILNIIGAGSYGLVYLCRELVSNERKVIKQLRPSKHMCKKEVDMFKEEMSILSSLNHRNIPKIFETFSSNGSLFYVMSYIEGDNLEDLIFHKKRTFNEEEALFVLTHLLDFIDYLHSIDIFHLDIRIPNVMENNAEFYLIDLGLAQSPQNQQEMIEMKLQDYYDLGEILLYLLYTTFNSKYKKALPWTEELSLKPETVRLLKRLLQINQPYSDIAEIKADLQSALNVQADPI